MSHVMNTYARLPVAFTHGDGVWLHDETGKRYLDALSGIAVSTLGHNHPRLVRAISQQASRVLHTSNLYGIPLQDRLGDRLAELSGMEEVFFCNSGCEANEAAIKLARMFGHQKGIELPTIIVMESAFHGRTMATLSATGNRKAQAGFEPLVSGFVRVPYKDIAAIRQAVEHNHQVVAVMLEMIQGEGGINIADDAFQREVRALCDERGLLMICDEVQCGVGRTGRWFGWQHAGVMPDVMTLAKGLGSGVPIGACLTAGRAAGLFKPGNHGSTFGGNPLACAAGLATLDAIADDRLMENAVQVGNEIRAGLAEALKGVDGVVEIRGKGLMIGVELDRPCGELVKRGLDAGLLINVTAERVVRLLPALVFTSVDAQTLVDALAPLIRDFLSQ
ncbi:aspartate aminotransferase family protein [Parazoarcus communis]|uniref:Acetylornithine aminotransferase n=1 Tax=Parazoarcus communis SWub3 = DSM 12120 TaxID=1121029 RepID=A0A323UTF2_9RHOO|nr:aspartate aminotransferase family protein [Parazoarcus communis]NMG70558.1 acetylornithine/succinylornithine family transaminase [Parazoarcus communis SWub3 = DSM 12120]PZA15784.1 aspartate aminotransferase family protein [Azoarcus communis] [Parazoarcus communis SWub3 = DSM 12120]